MNSERLAALLLGLFILLVPFYAESWGSDWQEYGKTRHATHYYDAENIVQVSKNTLRVWEKKSYSPEGVESWVKDVDEKFQELDYSILLCEINCVERKMKVLQSTEYRKNSSVIHFSREIQWQHIIPESIGEWFLNGVCKGHAGNKGSLPQNRFP